VYGTGTDGPGITIATGTADTGSLYFADGTSGDATYRGSIAYAHSADAMVLYTAATERMRIDSSGNVGIGTTSPGTYAKFAVWGTENIPTYGDVSAIFSDGTTGSARFHHASGNVKLSSDSALAFGLYTAATERMRIDSSGQILMNCTSQIGGGYIQHLKMNSGTGGIAIQNYGASNTAIVFRNSANNGTVGSITTDGTSTSYNVSSDYRLKENVIDIADGITRVKQLQPRKFNFIENPDAMVDGFIAHEAQTVVPEAVTGTHNETDDDGNAVMQGIDQSKLVPLLTAALQEAIAKIETLEAKVAALEGV
jgi:hypothetical protein